ncbi:MAG: tetratricopeptide repeat protein [Chitinivibrionales bacterium]|nr:tetratricopeptide repeat protein [Chitinivibrionales bacterium]
MYFVYIANYNSTKSADKMDKKDLDSFLEKYTPVYERTARKTIVELTRRISPTQIKAGFKFRVKSPVSYFNKFIALQKKQASADATINDLIGIRLIAPFIGDLETIENIIRDHYRTFEIEYKDEQYTIREFGYNSIHMLLALPESFKTPLPPFAKPAIEIQLRTTLQDAWAEIEHELVYKSNLAFPNQSLKRKLAALNATLTLADVTFQEIRDYQNEIRQRSIWRQRSLNERIEAFDDLMSHTDSFDNGRNNSRLWHHLEKIFYAALRAHSNNEYKSAVNLYTRSLQLNPGEHIRSIIYNHRGMARYVMGHINKAEDDFKKAIEYDYQNYRAYLNLGMVYKAKNNLAKAIKAFTSSLELYADQPDTYLQRSQAYAYNGEIECALKDCENALRIDKNHQKSLEFKNGLLKQMHS